MKKRGPVKRKFRFFLNVSYGLFPVLVIAGECQEKSLRMDTKKIGPAPPPKAEPIRYSQGADFPTAPPEIVHRSTSSMRSTVMCFSSPVKPCGQRPSIGKSPLIQPSKSSKDSSPPNSK